MWATKIAFISIIRTTFDVPLAEEMAQRAITTMRAAGFSLILPPRPLSTAAEAQHTAQQILTEKPDLLIVFQATFSDSTMVLTLVRAIDTPIVLWAIPEEHTGERLRLNSLCGINLAAHALTLNGYRYHHLYGAPDDSKTIEKLKTFATAAHVRSELRNVRIARIGENPVGFETCIMDDKRLHKQLGIEVKQISLTETVFEQVRIVSSSELQRVKNNLALRVRGMNELDSRAVNGTLGTFLTLQQIANDEGIHGFAVRCWPEFFTELGCAACGALSMLSDELIPCSCETDVNGTVSQLILQLVSGQPAFGSDIVSVDSETDTLILWHCGLAPLSMADSHSPPSVTIHSNRKLPLLMEFTLKPGPITLARLSQATGNFRLIIGKGEVISGPPAFSGTSGRVRFENSAGDVLETILTEGLEHHISLTYGDHVATLETLAHMLEYPILRL